MRYIDKSHRLSTVYFSWADDLDAQGLSHDPYHSKHRFYRDVLANLLFCQQGLCAYTEMRIATPTPVASDWSKGRFKGTYTSWADIEHFDPSLKKDSGWLWDNLFAVHSIINSRVKGTRPVSPILKPDMTGYDVFRLLVYVKSENRFIPHPDLTPKEKEEVSQMLHTLGVNDPLVVDRREEKFRFLEDDVKYGVRTVEQWFIEGDEFPTAFAMIVQNLGL